jgi:hypothetical protein
MDMEMMFPVCCYECHAQLGWANPCRHTVTLEDFMFLCEACSEHAWPLSKAEKTEKIPS